MITEFAPAKVNLTLHVTGQRDDGYHLLDSLVVFADVGDQVAITAGHGLSLIVDGPEVEGVPSDQSNSVLKAARFFNPQAAGAAFLLTKNLPSAAGIGGGSADAAAAIRGLRRHWSDDGEGFLAGDVDLADLSNAQATRIAEKLKALGADVPVCLFSKPARMRGIGADLAFVEGLPQLNAILVNPRVAVSTPEVFAAIRNKTNPPMPDLPRFADASELINWTAQQRNDMEPATRSLFPQIGAVLSALSGLEGCQLARMSGSGATCFGLFETAQEAQLAAQNVRQSEPSWWVAPTTLGGQAPKPS